MEIAIYIAQDSPTRALGFVDELEAACERLGNAPGIGTGVLNWDKTCACGRMEAT